MAIFLTILKVIGIILLCIVGLALLLICLLLFVPVRYLVRAQKDTEPDSIDARVIISWLLHILHVSLIYKDGQLIARLRIFGICIVKRIILGDKEEKKESGTVPKESGRANEKTDTPETIDDMPTIAQLSDEEHGLYTIETADVKPSDIGETASINDVKEQSVNVPDEEMNTASSEPADDSTFAEHSDTSDKSDGLGMDASKSAAVDEDSEATTAPRESIFDKIADFVRAILNGITSLYNKIVQFFNDTESKIDKTQREIDFYKRFINDERNRLAFDRCVEELKRILRSIMPRRVKGDVHIGFDDPATTGQVLVFASVLYPLYGRNLHISPDFENSVIEGNIYIKGRVTLVILIIAAWRIYFNKNMRRLLHIYKRHKNGGTKS